MCPAFFAKLGQRRPWQSLGAAKLGASATYVQLHESEDLDVFACNSNSLSHGQLPASFDLFVFSWLWLTFSEKRSCRGANLKQVPGGFLEQGTSEPHSSKLGAVDELGGDTRMTCSKWPPCNPSDLHLSPCDTQLTH